MKVLKFIINNKTSQSKTNMFIFVVLLIVVSLCVVYAQVYEWNVNAGTANENYYGFADLTGDGVLELIGGTYPVVAVFGNGTILWEWKGDTGGTGDSQSYAGYEIDGDNGLEIVYSNAVGDVFIINGSTNETLSSVNYVSSNARAQLPAIGDLDNDGTVEIYFPTSDWLYVLNASNLTQELSSKDFGSSVGSVVITDCDDTNDGDEIALLFKNSTATYIGCVNSSNVSHSFWVKDFTSLALIENGYLLVGDVVGDSNLEFVTGTTYTDVFFVINSTGDVIHSLDIGGSSYGRPCLGDLDNDGKADIAIQDGTTGVHVYNGSLDVIWENTTTYLMYGDSDVVIADYDGDGDLDVSIVTYDEDAYFFDGATGEELFSIKTTDFSYEIGVGTADITGDGNLELVLFNTTSAPDTMVVYSSDGKTPSFVTAGVNVNRTGLVTVPEVDSSPPNINITFPINDSLHASNTIYINYTVSDTNLDSCWYSNDTYAVNTTLTDCANITGITWAEGNHNVTVWANDTSSNENSSSVTFNIDTIKPVLTMYIPATNQIFNYNESIPLNYTAVDSGSGMDECWYYIYYANGTLAKSTETLSECENTTFSLPSGENDFKITLLGKDLASNTKSVSNRPFSIDTVFPLISYDGTSDNDSTIISRNYILVNVTITETNLDSVVFNWNGTNETFDNNVGNNYWENKTGLSDGEYTFYSYVNDTAGNANQTATRTVTVDTTSPTVTFISQTPTDLMWNSTGIIEVLFNITDAGGINESSIVFFHGVNHSHDGLEHWNWSYRYPESTKQPDGRRAENRNESNWWEDIVYKESANDIWSFAVHDINTDVPLTIIDNSSIHTYTNFTNDDIHIAFPNMWYVDRDDLITENKTNQFVNIYKRHPAKIAYNATVHDLSENFTSYLHLNIETQAAINDLIAYVCNSTYTTGELSGDNNCQSLFHITGTETRTLTLANSSYIDRIDGGLNGKVGNVVITDNMFLVLTSREPTVAKAYKLYYANNTVADNINFNETGVLETSTDNAGTWDSYSGTPDFWFSPANEEYDIVTYYVYACDEAGNCVNSTWQTDTLDVEINQPPFAPTVTYPQENYNISIPFYINWTTAGDLEGDPYNASVYLYNTDGTLNLTLADDNITDDKTYFYVNDTSILDAKYRINITLCDDSDACSSVLTGWNFSIDNTAPTISVISPTEGTKYQQLSVLFNVSASDSSGISAYWYNINSGATNVTFDGDEYVNLATEGSHSVTFWVNDSAGNENSASVAFTISLVVGPPEGQPTTPITLNSLNITYEKEWCFDEIYNITIKPLDLDEKLTEVDEMKQYSNAIFLQTGGLYEKNLVYYVLFYPDSSATNLTEKNITLTIQASQGGKVLSEKLHIFVKECPSEIEIIIENITENIGEFWRKYWLHISIFSLIILVCVILSIITKRFRKKKT